MRDQHINRMKCLEDGNHEDQYVYLRSLFFRKDSKRKDKEWSEVISRYGDNEIVHYYEAMRKAEDFSLSMNEEVDCFPVITLPQYDDLTEETMKTMLSEKMGMTIVVLESIYRRMKSAIKRQKMLIGLLNICTYIKVLSLCFTLAYTGSVLIASHSIRILMSSPAIYVCVIGGMMFVLSLLIRIAAKKKAITESVMETEQEFINRVMEQIDREYKSAAEALDRQYGIK